MTVAAAVLCAYNRLVDSTKVYRITYSAWGESLAARLALRLIPFS